MAALTILSTPQTRGGWVAYNDSAYKPGQENAPNVTTYGLGRNFQGEASSGHLIQFATGEITPVMVEFKEHVSTGSINSAGDPAQFPPGSDAEAYFKGIADLSGNMSYGDSPGWWLDLIFTGLDPGKGYTFVGTADRNGGEGYAARVTNWRIMNTASHVPASSDGAHRVGEDAVEFSTGHNVNGLVARWVDIQPGADGSFTIRTSHSVGEANGGIPGASAFQGYAGGLFMLAEQITIGGEGPDPVEFTSLFPAAGARDVHPNAPVVVVLRHGEAEVNPASVVLKFDGVEVPSQVISEAGTTTIRRQSEAMLAPGLSHTVNLTFLDDAPIPQTYSREWSFSVLDYSQALVVPAELAVNFNPSIHRTRGFALEIAAVDPFWDFVISDMETAEALWEWDFFNLVDESILNEFGYFIETQDLNYQIDGAPRGVRANDRLFPGIEREQSGDQFALQAYALLHLHPGFYRMNVSMTQEFKIAVGGSGEELEVPAEFTPCANCSGDDAPWILEFVVTQEGVYPFRLLYYSPGGSASLEWVVVTPSGSRLLVNEDGLAGIPAYVPAFALPLGPALAIDRVGLNLTISWEGAGVLESATNVSGPWNEVPNVGSPHTAATGESRRFYRLKR
jgi:hypothetical protein